MVSTIRVRTFPFRDDRTVATSSGGGHDTFDKTVDISSTVNILDWNINTSSHPLERSYPSRNNICVLYMGNRAFFFEIIIGRIWLFRLGIEIRPKES